MTDGQRALCYAVAAAGAVLAVLLGLAGLVDLARAVWPGCSG